MKITEFEVNCNGNLLPVTMQNTAYLKTDQKCIVTDESY